MDWLSAMLALGFLGALGLCAWMWAERARARAACAAAEGRAGEAQKREEGLITRAEELSRRVTELSVKAAELSARVEHEREAARAHAENITRVFEERREADGKVYREKAESIERSRAELEKRIEEFGEQARQAFGTMAGQALRESSEQFLKLAQERMAAAAAAGETSLEKRQAAFEQLVRPISDAMKRADEKLAGMEKQRGEADAQLRESLMHQTRAAQQLQHETRRLVSALREPNVRGRYGEVQLRRVAELAGMRPYCDFAEQETVTDSDGRTVRPDMVVKLPSGREVAVDAKTNLKAYLEAMEAATPEDAESHMQDFADGVAKQAAELGKKGYWRNYAGSPEFVVMFVPGDQFVDAALSRRPDLMEAAATHRVLLASPTTLIALLKAVYLGYQEQRLAKEAAELRAEGKELLKRAQSALEHAEKMGKALNAVVTHFNGFVGSYQSRLEPTLRRFEAMGDEDQKSGLASPAIIEVRARSIEGTLPERNAAEIEADA